MQWKDTMRLGAIGYYADFFASLACSVALCALAIWQGTWLGQPEWLVSFLMGVGLWTLLEYGIHRWLYHGVDFFKRLHGAHHDEPCAYISAPPFLGIASIFLVVHVPLATLSLVVASGVTSGVLLGYFGYQLVHHATHFWHPARGSYLYRVRLRHSLHHFHDELGNFGITTAFWDQVFGTAIRTARRPSATPARTADV
jgi:sterol desaturase/sphingolipid hydroxylase (fatty acid hydroxylase superfamily)